MLFLWQAFIFRFSLRRHDVNHIGQGDTAIIFGIISLFALLFQPFLGLLFDKLGLRKHLLWLITALLVMFAPLLSLYFRSLLRWNIIAGANVAGI